MLPPETKKRIEEEFEKLLVDYYPEEAFGILNLTYYIPDFIFTIIDETLKAKAEEMEKIPYPPLPLMEEVIKEAKIKNNTVNYELGFIHGLKSFRQKAIKILTKV